MTVVPRSYSRQIGATSCESDTVRCGKRSARRARAATSCSGFRYEKRKQTATAGCSPPAASRFSSERRERLEVDRVEDATLLVEALADADAVGPVRERGGLAPVEVVVVLAVDPLDVEDVLEPLRRQVHDARASAGQDGVDADRRPHDHEADLGRVEAGGIEGGVDRGDRVLRIGGNLRDVPAAGCLVDRDEIRERSSGVDPDRDPHPWMIVSIRASARRERRRSDRAVYRARRCER